MWVDAHVVSLGIRWDDGSMSSPESPRPLRIGLVGAGFIARWVMEAVAVLPQARVVAVTSARPDSARAFAREHSIPSAWPSLEEMLRAGRAPGSEIDLVYIGSPNAVHASQAVAALEAGYHVLVEKPFAMDEGQARDMVAAAAAHDRFLMEGWLPAFEPGTEVLRRSLPALVADGPGPHRALLIKEQLSSRLAVLRDGGLPPAFDPRMGGGSLMDLGTYPICLAIHLFGPPARVSATGRLLASGADSHGAVVLDYDCLPDGSATDLQVVCLHSKTSQSSGACAITSDHLALTFDDAQWPRRITLRGPHGEQDLSVEANGPVLARELAEVCRLVASGARQCDLHPLAHSVEAARVLSLAREQIGWGSGP